jgi:hypothetical protein
VYSVSLCCSVYCLCVNVYCTTATGCQPNCSKQIYQQVYQQIAYIEGSYAYPNKSATWTHPEPEKFSPRHLFRIRFNIILLSIPRSRKSPSPFVFRLRLFSRPFTCPFHLIELDVIILMIFGKEYKLRIFPPCSFLQPPLNPNSLRYVLSLLIPWLIWYVLSYLYRG